MARGMMPRPPSNPGRSQPPRRGTPAGGQRTTQRSTPLRGPGAEQLRQQQAEAQRQAAARAAQQQQRVRQAQYMREAQRARRREEAKRRTEQLRHEVARLESILATGLERSAGIDLDALRQTSDQVPFDPGPLGTPAPEPVESDFTARGVAGMLGGKARKQRRAAAARQAYERAHEEWETAEQERKEKLADAQRAHETAQASKREEVERYRSRVARVAAGLRDRDPAAVESFLRTVLRRVPLPVAFPRRAEVTHHQVRELAQVRMIVPGREVIPEVSGYEYEPPDDLRAVPRLDEDIDELYRLVLAQVVLLVVRDVFEADQDLEQLTVHGLVDRFARATGKHELRSVISLDVSREEFEAVDLAQTPPEEAALRLGARFAADPAASQPV
jgi:restriction system protein